MALECKQPHGTMLMTVFAVDSIESPTKWNLSHPTVAVAACAPDIEDKAEDGEWGDEEADAQ